MKIVHVTDINAESDVEFWYYYYLQFHWSGPVYNDNDDYSTEWKKAGHEIGKALGPPVAGLAAGIALAGYFVASRHDSEKNQQIADLRDKNEIIENALQKAEDKIGYHMSDSILPRSKCPICKHLWRGKLLKEMDLKL